MTPEPIEFSPKQLEAFEALHRRSHYTRVLYGGAAGGGKSFLGIHWQIVRRIMYAGTNGVIGRNSLNDLRKFTVPEVFSQLKKYNVRAGVDVTFNGQDHYFKFWNGSKIFLLDMYAYPTDPDFQRFGSTEYMDAFVEEAAEITEKAVDILGSRLRHKITEFCRDCGAQGLNTGHVVDIAEDGRLLTWECPKCHSINGGMIPKMLITCNPSPNWLRTTFYEPWKKGTLPHNLTYIPATTSDNKHLSIEYVRALEAMPEMDRKRLLYGDWDYGNAADTMFHFTDIEAAFVDREVDGEMYITADVARLGKDRTVIGVWKGLALLEIIELKQSRVNDTAEAIRAAAQRYGMNLRNIIVDEDGVGGGVTDLLRCTGFLNGSAAVDSDRYAKRKDECYFKLAEYFEQGRMCIRVKDKQHIITKELQAVRRAKPDGNTKLAVISKDEMKRHLNGQSPDYADMLMMRMLPETKSKGKVYVRTISMK